MCSHPKRRRRGSTHTDYYYLCARCEGARAERFAHKRVKYTHSGGVYLSRRRRRGRRGVRAAHWVLTSHAQPRVSAACHMNFPTSLRIRRRRQRRRRRRCLSANLCENLCDTYLRRRCVSRVLRVVCVAWRCSAPNFTLGCSHAVRPLRLTHIARTARTTR